MPDEALLARIDRLESLDEIRQLAAKYSLALDMRDLDAMVNLFPEDVRVGKDKVGRAHFKQWMDETLRVQFTGTSHHQRNCQRHTRHHGVERRRPFVPPHIAR